MILTLGVLSTNLCFPSSGPSCAFSLSSFDTSSSICGEKVGAGPSHRQLTFPLNHSFNIPPSGPGTDLSPQPTLASLESSPATSPPSSSSSLPAGILLPHIPVLYRPPQLCVLPGLALAPPCRPGRTCSALAFCCFSSRTCSP